MGLGILCAGQGTQYQEMFSKLVPLPSELGPYLNLSAEQWYANEFAQPMIAAQTFLSWQALQPQLPVPIAFLGYSLGELSAYACAGCFDLKTLIQLAKTRAALMNNACQVSGGLVSIRGLNKETILALCQKTGCFISIINGPAHYLLGGTAAALHAVTQRAAEQIGFQKATPLQVSVPSHTPLLAQAAQDFAKTLAQQAMKKPIAPIIAGIDSRVIEVQADIISTLSAQIAQTIDFEKALRTAVELGVSTFLEIGPGHALAGIAKSLNLPVQVKSVDDFTSLAGVLKWVAAQC